MDIYTSIRFSGDTAANDVDYTKYQCSLLFGKLDGGKSVCRLSALADGNHHIVLFYHRIAIAELTGIFHLHSYAAHILDELFADKSGMP